MTRRLVQLLLLLALPVALDAQNPPPPPATAQATSPLRVFVDNCPCSLDYLRTGDIFNPADPTARKTGTREMGDAIAAGI